MAARYGPWTSGDFEKSEQSVPKDSDEEAQLEERVRHVCRSADAASALRLEKGERSLAELEEKETAMISEKVQLSRRLDKTEHVVQVLENTEREVLTMSEQTTRRLERVKRQCIALEERVLVEARMVQVLENAEREMVTMSEQTMRRLERIKRQCIALEERMDSAISARSAEAFTVRAQELSSFLESQGRVSSPRPLRQWKDRFLAPPGLKEEPVISTRLSRVHLGPHRTWLPPVLFPSVRVHLAACGPLPLGQTELLESHHLSTSPASRTVPPGCGRGHTTMVCLTTLPKKTACTHEVGARKEGRRKSRTKEEGEARVGVPWRRSAESVILLARGAEAERGQRPKVLATPRVVQGAGVLVVSALALEKAPQQQRVQLIVGLCGQILKWRGSSCAQASLGAC